MLRRGQREAHEACVVDHPREHLTRGHEVTHIHETRREHTVEGRPHDLLVGARQLALARGAVHVHTGAQTLQLRGRAIGVRAGAADLASRVGIARAQHAIGLVARTLHAQPRRFDRRAILGGLGVRDAARAHDRERAQLQQRIATLYTCARFDEHA